ncbi:hypothetical protein AKJ09_00928 [Labilithrix luteola]|uniref:Uncharacterized protein n=1 Tax=Labilithrix luteola TaxID=1391654 RepID=A0A0K1PME5_9BACT|nr:hypothetical protein AKJ09_00928 [Labilithrix luteola]
MLPFSKRPPPPDEFFLRSGDFESIEVDDAPPVVPPAPQPRQVWNRTVPRAQEHRAQLPSETVLRRPPSARSYGRHSPTHALPAANPRRGR